MSRNARKTISNFTTDQIEEWLTRPDLPKETYQALADELKTRGLTTSCL